jgi:hypothetical protein
MRPERGAGLGARKKSAPRIEPNRPLGRLSPSAPFAGPRLPEEAGAPPAAPFALWAPVRGARAIQAAGGLGPRRSAPGRERKYIPPFACGSPYWVYLCTPDPEEGWGKAGSPAGGGGWEEGAKKLSFLSLVLPGRFRTFALPSRGGRAGRARGKFGTECAIRQGCPLGGGEAKKNREKDPGKVWLIGGRFRTFALPLRGGLLRWPVGAVVEGPGKDPGV